MSVECALERIVDHLFSDVRINRRIDANLVFLRICAYYETNILWRLQGWEHIRKVSWRLVHYLIGDVAIVRPRAQAPFGRRDGDETVGAAEVHVLAVDARCAL